MFKELVVNSRSKRRFYGEKRVTKTQLRELVDLARLSPSAANKQSLKYIIVNSPDINRQIFETLTWAGYLKDWNGPEEKERPTGYIIMLRDKAMRMNIDEGIAAQSIFLGATAMGLGGCFIASIKKSELKNILNITTDFDISIVIALGYPKEEVVIDEVKEGKDIRYWRDKNQVHHVPKKTLDQLIVKEETE